MELKKTSDLVSQYVCMSVPLPPPPPPYVLAQCRYCVDTELGHEGSSLVRH